MVNDKELVIEKKVEDKEEVLKVKNSTLTLINNVKALVKDKDDTFSLSLNKNIDMILSLVDRGRIRLFNDFLEIGSYLSQIETALNEDDTTEYEAVVNSLNNYFDMVKARHWYVVNTYSGHENRVKENLERRVETMGIEDNLFQILVAEEDEIEVRNDKQVTKKKNLYPGYLFVEMVMTDEAWYVVRNTPGVTGFIGSSGGGAKPFPVSDEEIESILRRIGVTDVKVVANFEVGDIVKILNGPFRGIEGSVESMNDETAKASILTIMFGRETSTEVDYLDLVKVD